MGYSFSCTIALLALCFCCASVNCQTDPDRLCGFVINELNTDGPHLGSQEFSEFVELKLVCSRRSTSTATDSQSQRLRDYLLIGVQEFHGKFRQPAITFSADFYRTSMKESTDFFVIASKDKISTADMYFTDSAIGYTGKSGLLLSKEAPAGASQSSIFAFFKAASKQLPSDPNVLKNGNGKSPMALMLLYQKDYSRNEDAADYLNSIAKLRLAKMHPSNRRPTFVDRIPIDEDLTAIIQRRIHDMIIYARGTQNSRCTFFESIDTSLKDRPAPDYILNPAREWDEKGHEDYSINRCPLSAAEERKPLLFTRWKLGRVTPGEVNDCSGAHWILEENLPAILSAARGSGDGAAAAHSRKLEAPPSQCSASSHREELLMAVQNPEVVASNRDLAVQNAEIEIHGADATTHAYCSSGVMSAEREAVFEINEETRRLETEFVRQSNAHAESIAIESCPSTDTDTEARIQRPPTSATTIHLDSDLENDGQRSESPPRKRVCTSDCTSASASITIRRREDVLIREWEDKTGFRDEWLDSLELHQGRHFSRKFVSDEMKAWFFYVPNSEQLEKSGIQCRICRKYVIHCPHAEVQVQQRKVSFAFLEGFIPSKDDKKMDSVRRKLQQHGTSALHREAIKWMKKKHNSLLCKQVRAMQEADRLAKRKKTEITTRVLTTVYAEAKANIPFSAHRMLIQLQKSNGLLMGTHHDNRQGATKMTQSISKTMHNSLLKYILESSLPISIVLDTTSDFHSNSYLMIYFRMLEKSKPIMYFYRFKQLSVTETGQNILDMLKDLFTQDSIATAVSQRLWGVTTDGASVMAGSRVGLTSLLKRWAQNNFFQHHCAAHKLELSVYHAFKSFPYMQRLDAHINLLHSFYMSHAVKRKASLAETSVALDAVFYNLKRIYRIRWVASEVAALEVVRKSYYTLITNLENIKSPASEFDDESKATATGLLYTLQNIRYYALHLFILDVLKSLELQSMQFQKTQAAFIGLQKRHDALINSLEVLKTENGPSTTAFLKSCRCRVVTGHTEETEYRSHCRTHDLSHSDFKCFIGQEKTQYFELRQPCSVHAAGTRGRPCASSASSSAASTAERSGNKFPPLKDIRANIIDNIITQLQRYFPEETYSIFDVLDPKALPTEDTLGSVFVYSAKIIPLARRLGMQDDSAEDEMETVSSDSDSDSSRAQGHQRRSPRTISGQFQILIHSLIAHKIEFCAYKLKSPVSFWAFFLEVQTVEWMPKIKKLIQVVLALPISSADAERGFSIYKHIAYDRRTRLTPANIEHLLRIRINGPPLRKFIPDIYVNDWLKSHWASDAPGGRDREDSEEDETSIEEVPVRSTLF